MADDDGTSAGSASPKAAGAARKWKIGAVKTAPSTSAGHVHGPGCTHDKGPAGHVHGPGCTHDEGPAGHVHGPGCTHDHGGGAHVERAAGTRAAESGGTACQLELDFLLPGETDDKGRFEMLERLLEARQGISDVHLRRDDGRAEVCVHYNAQAVTLSQVLALVRTAGGEVSKRYKQHTWFVRGMESAQCGYVIEHVLHRMTGVMQANVAYAAERLIVEYDSHEVNLNAIVDKVAAIGYVLEEPESGHACSCHSHDGGLASRLEMPMVIVAGLLIVLGYLLSPSGVEAPPLLSKALCALALLSAGYLPVRGALRSVRNGVVDIEVLMVLAGAAAPLANAWFEGAFLIFLFSFGHALEHRAMEHARRSIEALSKLCPPTAHVMRGDQITEMNVDQVRVADVVVVRPGDRVPLDGVVRSGITSIDQATITGESVPVSKQPGDPVYSGTINVDAAIEVEVTRLSSESVLAKIVNMVADAEAHKSATQRFAKRLEQRFVPIVLVAAPTLTLVLLGIALTNGAFKAAPLDVFKAAALRGLSLLVAASPCALAIATPAAVLSAVARAARGGVLIKGGAYLEALGRITAVAFDKTGTLTEGRPRIVALEPAPGVDESTLLRLAASAETKTSHPLAQAIVTGAAERNLAFAPAETCTVVSGKGLRAEVGGTVVEVGSVALFDGVALPAAVADAVKRLESAGQTTMIVREGEQRFLGVIGVADTLRPDSKPTLARLQSLGVTKTVMLSGDNNVVAQAIGQQVGITEIRAPLMPEGKVTALRELSRQGHGIAMVGDGVNDAPALAAATVGVAVGGTGSDVALETADLVLMSDGLARLPFALELARASNRVIRQNLFIALGVSGVLIVASIFGWVEISSAVVLHEGSTLVVVTNGLRLLWHRG